LDFGHEDESYIHEFIWYQKEKKSKFAILRLNLACTLHKCHQKLYM